MLGLVLAFWAAGAQREGQQALAGAALGLAAFAVIVQAAPGVGHDAARRRRRGGPRLLARDRDRAPAGRLRAAPARASGRPRSRSEAERLEREREEQARAAVAAERARIARDLHDVIAHSVSVMTVQGGAARLLLDQDARRAREPLLAVEETGRQALAEMRRLLGIVHAEGDAPALAPQPGLADLEALVEQMRRAGLPVALEVHGAPQPLAPGVELAAYRIVQEALTNALKHAGPARARVTVRYEPERSSSRSPTTAAASRAATAAAGTASSACASGSRLYGGELAAGPRAEGGFAVRARLPLGQRAASDLQSRPRARDDGTGRPATRIGTMRFAVAGSGGIRWTRWWSCSRSVQQLEAWVGSVPGPSVAVSVASLLWTLPLLLRRRFPFAAPAFAFAVQIALVVPRSRGLRRRGHGLRGPAPHVLGRRGAQRARAGARPHRDRLRRHRGRRAPGRPHRYGRGDRGDGGRRRRRADRLRARAPRPAGRRARGAGGPPRARARGAGARRGRRRARADRPRAPRRRRPQRRRHDRAGADGSPASLDEDPERAREPIARGRGDRPPGARRAAPPARDPAPGAGRAAPRAPAGPGGPRRPPRAGARGRAAGRAHGRGRPAALAPGVDLAAYRIVQEALTNALEHAGPAHAQVAVRYGRDALELEIADDGGDGRRRPRRPARARRPLRRRARGRASRRAATTRCARGSRSRRARP